jgi:hypothetical protein
MPVEGKRRDFVWRSNGVVSRSTATVFHKTAAAFERDGLRGNEVALAGWVHLRFTPRRVVLRSAEVHRDLERALRVGSRAP